MFYTTEDIVTFTVKSLVHKTIMGFVFVAGDIQNHRVIIVLLKWIHYEEVYAEKASEKCLGSLRNDQHKFSVCAW